MRKESPETQREGGWCAPVGLNRVRGPSGLQSEQSEQGCVGHSGLQSEQSEQGCVGHSGLQSELLTDAPTSGPHLGTPTPPQSPTFWQRASLNHQHTLCLPCFPGCPVWSLGDQPGSALGHRRTHCVPWRLLSTGKGL